MGRKNPNGLFELAKNALMRVTLAVISLLAMATASVTPPALAFASTTPTKRKRVLSRPAMESSATTPNSGSGGKKAKAKIVMRTESFDAVVDPSVAPRVLILGSHPSSKSLEKVQYYGRRTNAFWWLVADALGFAFDPKDVKQAPGNIKVGVAHRLRSGRKNTTRTPHPHHRPMLATTPPPPSTRSTIGERRRSSTMTTTQRCES